MRLCKICGRPFLVLRPNYRSFTCSERCSKIYRRKRNNEYSKNRYKNDPEFRERIISTSLRNQRKRRSLNHGL